MNKAFIINSNVYNENPEKHLAIRAKLQTFVNEVIQILGDDDGRLFLEINSNTLPTHEV